jgi:hypothetical protein
MSKRLYTASDARRYEVLFTVNAWGTLYPATTKVVTAIARKPSNARNRPRIADVDFS